MSRGKLTEDLLGQKFNRLTVIEYLGNSRWRVLCDCGAEIITVARDLKNGHTKSCGCCGKELFEFRDEQTLQLFKEDCYWNYTHHTD